MAGESNALDRSGLRSRWHIMAIGLVIVAATAFRLRGYGDLNLSVATDDTAALVETAGYPLSSARFFISTRSVTTSLLYKLLEPKDGYELTAVSRPAESGPTDRTAQRGGDRIAIAQTILSIIAWCALAISAARRVRNPFLKAGMAAVVLAFAFTPQLAEWDSILITESISFSLYALLLAGTLEVSARMGEDGRRVGMGTWALVLGWFAVLMLWVFTRDSNAYSIPVTLVLTALVLVLPSARKRLPARALVGVSALVLVLFVGQSRLLFASDRWVNPYLNNLIHRIMPDGNRLAYFVVRGMPHTGDIMAFATSRGNEVGLRQIKPLMDWVLALGPKTYVSYLISHPQWTLLTLTDNLQFLFSENRQPFFLGPLAGYRSDWTADIGTGLHMLSSGASLISCILTAALLAAIWRRRLVSMYGLAWTAAWQLFVSLVILVVSFYGDSLGVVRHAMGAVEPLRLSAWMLSIFLADVAIAGSKPAEPL